MLMAPTSLRHDMPTYVHGYEARESERLEDQARILEALLHEGTVYPPGSRVLEAGCGTGAQTVALARRSPQARFTAVDLDAASLSRAQARLQAAGIAGVQLQRADLRAPPFPAASFDHVFVCFVLEHLREPAAVLGALGRLLRPGGTLTVIEGDHGSVLIHPQSAAVHDAVDGLVKLQARAGGDACIGRRLHPLLVEAGMRDVRVQPRVAYADGSRPDWAEAFTRRTFAAMVEGVREPLLAAGLATPERFDEALRALERAAELDGSFCYTFFRAVAVSDSSDIASRSHS
jgi:SAM-dependent methyltransferase